MLSLQDKMQLMTEASLYDISEEDLTKDMFFGGGIRNSSLPPPNKVPKVFMTNNCAFNCQYCGCRCSNDRKLNYVIAPKELAEISVRGAKLNSHGVFLTSAVYKNPDYTQELINKTLWEIRYNLGYKGYLHAKVMPGADERLIYEAGFMADRLSVNIELPQSEGYKTIAKQKNKNNILRPMGAISRMIKELDNKTGRRFAKSGQTTQLMVGAMGEDDRTIMRLSEAMYKKYSLRRVYYSAFFPVQETSLLPSESAPSWRKNRLYQADRLLAGYGMTAEELTPSGAEFLERDIDPKTAWALRNIGMFPIEVNSADYETLVRVPGIGPTGANRIIQARRYGNVTPEDLRKIRVSLKHSIYFITVNGRYYGGISLDSQALRMRLTSSPVKPVQMSIWD